MAADDPFAHAPPMPEEPAAGAPLAPVQPQQPRTQKPRSNVYTMMLILSFAAIVTACVLLYLQLAEYGDFPWWDASGV